MYFHRKLFAVIRGTWTYASVFHAGEQIKYLFHTNPEKLIHVKKLRPIVSAKELIFNTRKNTYL
jgi:hypothetical protein